MGKILKKQWTYIIEASIVRNHMAVSFLKIQDLHWQVFGKSTIIGDDFIK